MDWDLEKEKKEAADLFRLGSLLQKQRSELKTRLVTDVLRRALSTEEKISNINAIDLKDENDPELTKSLRSITRHAGSPKKQASERQASITVSGQPERSTGQQDRTERDEAKGRVELGDQALQTQQDEADEHEATAKDSQRRSERPGEESNSQLALRLARRARSTYFKEPPHGSLIMYFFVHRKKIAEFGALNGFISRGSFPFTLRLGEDGPSRFDAVIKQRLCPALIQVLERILQRGWLVLTKREYNLFSAFKQLIELVKKTESLQGSNRLQASSYAPFCAQLSPQLLAFTRPQALYRELLDCVKQKAATLALSSEDYKQVHASCTELFSEHEKDQSLLNFVRALWMLRTHHPVVWDELVPQHKQSLISSERFDCSQEVQVEIDRHLKGLRERLSSLDQERIVSQRLQFYVPPGEYSQEPDKALLSAWIMKHLELLGEGELEMSETILNSQPAMLALLASKLILLRYFPLVHGDLKLSSKSYHEYLGVSSITAKFSRMALLQERLSACLVACPHMTRARYEFLKPDPSKGERAETELMHALIELASLATSMANHLCELVLTRSRKAQAIQKLDQDPGDELAFPDEDQIISFPLYLQGATVLGLLTEAIQMLYLMGLTLNDLSVYPSWRRLQGLGSDLSLLADEYERVGAPEQYLQIRREFAELFACISSSERGTTA